MLLIVRAAICLPLIELKAVRQLLNFMISGLTVKAARLARSFSTSLMQLDYVMLTLIHG